jgi:hypothetical protein
MTAPAIVPALNSVIDGSATGLPVVLNGFALAGVVIPASMSGASLTFQVSFDEGVTWLPMRDDLGNTLTVTIVAGAAFYSLRRILPLGIAQIRPVSSATETSKTVTFVGQRIV